MKFETYYPEFIRAIDDEIQALRTKGGQKTYLSDGRYLGVRDGAYIYSFTADTELKFPDETPVDLEYQRRKYEGKILSIDGFDIVLALQDFLGDNIATAILYTEPWFLLEALKERLIAIRSISNQELAAQTQARALRLLDQAIKINQLDTVQVKQLLNITEQQLHKRLTHNQHQLEAVAHVLSNQVSFIWGPPGTGKTKTLGLSVAALVSAGKSVLVVAHSNVAVDVAMLSIAENLCRSPEYETGRILRFGVSYKPEIRQYPNLDVREVLRRQNPELIARIEELEQTKRRLTQKSREAKLSSIEKDQINQRLGQVNDSLHPLYESLKEVEKNLVQQARIVGCTLSKATISDLIAERQFNAVLIDEVSMAYVPHCVFASSLATSHSAVFGDFRQLAPISQADTFYTRKWLVKDIFEKAGIIDKVEQGQTDRRLILLATQYRMHPDISAVPNRLFYRNLLCDGPNVRADNEPIAACRPAPGQALVLGDLSEISAHCFKDKESGSRFNLVSGLMAVQLAHALVSTTQHRVGIVTPYRAQSRLVGRLLRDLKISQEQVYVATVHRFQGSENDVIIFDTVEGPPRRKPGKLVVGVEDSTAMRLANVAISRAKGKFISLVNLDYIRFNLSRTDSFRQLVDAIAETTPPNRFGWTGPVKIDFPGTTYFPNGQVARHEIEQDILGAREEIAIFWSHLLQDYHFPASILGRRDPAKVIVYVQGAGSNQFDFGLKNTQIWQDQSRLPVGVVGIDRKRLWFYVEPENHNGPVLRINMSNTSKLLYSFWRLIPEEAGKQTLGDKAKAGKGPVGMPCPHCHSLLWLEVGKYGPYMKCTGCSYTKAITEKDATEYAQLMGIYCELCGATAVGRRGRNGVFLACSNRNCRWTKSLRQVIC
ncbi:MAG TPA: AAA domain-containing protein [Anaerolineae bacterium]|nr:AAA domain-containing protein [Anaerolineae bacterium]